MNKSNAFSSKESRLRAMLSRNGYSLRKTRYRLPDLRRAYPGYMIQDSNNRIVAGAWPHQFSMTLDEVEAFLKEIVA